MYKLLIETFIGCIHTELDIIILVDLCQKNVLGRVTRRLHDTEKRFIKDGSIFVYEEKESGIKRWTDGKIWSPSRSNGIFLCYREYKPKGKLSTQNTFEYFKKTITAKFTDKTYHIITYQNLEDELSGKCCFKYGNRLKMVYEEYCGIKNNKIEEWKAKLKKQATKKYEFWGDSYEEDGNCYESFLDNKENYSMNNVVTSENDTCKIPQPANFMANNCAQIFSKPNTMSNEPLCNSGNMSLNHKILYNCQDDAKVSDLKHNDASETKSLVDNEHITDDMTDKDAPKDFKSSKISTGSWNNTKNSMETHYNSRKPTKILVVNNNDNAVNGIGQNLGNNTPNIFDKQTYNYVNSHGGYSVYDDKNNFINFEDNMNGMNGDGCNNYDIGSFYNGNYNNLSACNPEFGYNTGQEFYSFDGLQNEINLYSNDNYVNNLNMNGYCQYQNWPQNTLQPDLPIVSMPQTLINEKADPFLFDEEDSLYLNNPYNLNPSYFFDSNDKKE